MDTEAKNTPAGKKELISRMAEISGLSKEACGKALDAFTAATGENLSSGRQVKITGFGTFGVTEVAEKTVKSAFTGDMVTVAAHRRVSFRPGQVLKDTVNGRIKD